jgi:RnfABCDGE-type electron transport complex B subunit
MGIFIPLIVTAGAMAATGTAVGVVAGLIRRPFYTRLDRIRRTLPDLDCGVCGHARCIDFAEAVASGEAGPLGCIPGGPRTAHAIADALGIEAEPAEAAIAAVHCKGGNRETARRANYEGMVDCRAALLLDNGVKACVEGCLGLSTCVRECPFGALSINDDGVAVVDRRKCNGCGACVGACPRDLISIIPDVHKIFLACNNHDEGSWVSSCCSVGCTSCGECVDITPSGAVSMHDHLPVLDYRTPGENFLAAAYRCPSKCFVDLVKARPRANIDTSCDGCGDCALSCPVPGAITGSPGKRHVVRKELCIGCGRCLSVCPAHAVSLWGSLGYEGAPRMAVRTPRLR